MRASIFVISTALGGLALAHPGHDLSQEIAERHAYIQSIRSNSLQHCTERLKQGGVEARNIARRSAAADKARAAKHLRLRDIDDDLAKSHNQTGEGYTENTDISKLFASNNSCLLMPEVTQGPYYVGGEQIRKNVKNSEKGVDLVIDYQVIDVDTCDPVPDVYVEMWHCNSTGVYSGVVANGNGDISDQSNLNNTALRGIQRTDSDGVVQFDSVFPGHYSGRATHIHVMIHANATLYSNNTLGNVVYASHVGQAFFDQQLIRDVDTISPYSTNEQKITENSDDSILSQEAATDNADPLASYVYLGDSVEDGLFAWLAFGINTSYSAEVGAASFRYASGGVANSNGGMGGGGGGGGGGGSPPSGNSSMSGGGPSGTPPGTNMTMSALPTGNGTPTPATTSTSDSVTTASTTPSSVVNAEATATGAASSKRHARGLWSFLGTLGFVLL